MPSKRVARVNEARCVACGACEAECPREAIQVQWGCFAQVDGTRCVGCGICARTCPAGCISILDREEQDK